VSGHDFAESIAIFVQVMYDSLETGGDFSPIEMPSVDDKRLIMSTITTTVIYKKGVLYPTEQVELTEASAYTAVLLPLSTATEKNALSDEEILRRQRLALQALLGAATTEEIDNASIEHDRYLYGQG
jgi:predicted DNA-binding antitoxin AbrB/MazE fold protein